MLSGTTGDVRKILIIRPLFYRIPCNSNNMSGNKLPTGFIQIKLILGLNSYDKMQLYTMRVDVNMMITFSGPHGYT